MDDVAIVVEELPPKLQALVAMTQHKTFFMKISLFRSGSYPGSFFSWLSARLKHMLICEEQNIFEEGDGIHNLYFVNRGLFGFVVTAYNSVYLKIEPGDIFGVIDIVANQRRKEQYEDSDSSSEEDEEVETSIHHKY